LGRRQDQDAGRGGGGGDEFAESGPPLVMHYVLSPL